MHYGGKGLYRLVCFQYSPRKSHSSIKSLFSPLVHNILFPYTVVFHNVVSCTVVSYIVTPFLLRSMIDNTSYMISPFTVLSYMEPRCAAVLYVFQPYMVTFYTLVLHTFVCCLNIHVLHDWVLLRSRLSCVLHSCIIQIYLT